MRCCCDKSNDNDEEANLEGVNEETINCQPKKKNGISDLDVREWTVELRENDLRSGEQNIRKKERRNLDNVKSIEKAKDDLNNRKIKLDEEIVVLTAEKRTLSDTLNDPNRLKMSFDFIEAIERSYRVDWKSQKEEFAKIEVQNINQNTPLSTCSEMRLNEDEGTGSGKIWKKNKKQFEKLHLERICNINAIYNIFPDDDSNPRP